MSPFDVTVWGLREPEPPAGSTSEWEKPAPQPVDQTMGWQASLQLEFVAGHKRSYLGRSRHRGPLVVQRPFFEAGGTCQVYLVHPPGGIVAGDALQVDVQVRSGAQVLITTPGAAKFYRSLGPFARQVQTLRVEAGGCLEWLPQEVIVFDGARALVTTRVDLAEGARVAVWEIVSLGRPSAHERFRHGEYRQRSELWCGSHPIFIDQARYTGSSEVLDAAWGLSGRPVTGTLVAYPARDDAVAAVRALPSESDAGWLSVTRTRDVLICRYLGRSTHTAREVLGRAWAVLRPRLFGKEAQPPRIWAT